MAVATIGRRAITLEADIRDLTALRAAVVRTRSELGGLDVAVANTGINRNTGFLEENDEVYRQAWDNVTAVNVRGTADTLRAVIPVMAEGGAAA